MEEKQPNGKVQDPVSDIKQVLESGLPLEEKLQIELLNRILEINH